MEAEEHRHERGHERPREQDQSAALVVDLRHGAQAGRADRLHHERVDELIDACPQEQEGQDGDAADEQAVAAEAAGPPVAQVEPVEQQGRAPGWRRPPDKRSPGWRSAGRRARACAAGELSRVESSSAAAASTTVMPPTWAISWYRVPRPKSGEVARRKKATRAVVPLAAASRSGATEHIAEELE